MKPEDFTKEELEKLKLILEEFEKELLMENERIN